MPNQKRKRGRPRTDRKGYKVTMLPQTYRALNDLAEADAMRLGAWLDQKIGPDREGPDHHDVEAGLRNSLVLRRLVNTAWKTTFQLRTLHDMLDEEPRLVKDEEVFNKLHVLALAWKPLLHHLRHAGLGSLVG